MDSCPTGGDALSAYLDGELPAAESRMVEEHLAKCPRCQAEFDGLRQVKRFMAPGSPLAPTMPKDLADRVRLNVYPRPRWCLSAVRRPLLPRPVFHAGSTTLVTMLVMAVLVVMLGANLISPSPVAAAAEATLHDHVICAQLGRVIQSLPGDVDQVSAQLANVVGMSIAVPRNVPEGFHFAGGRAIRAGDITSAHLAWLKGSTMLSYYQAADPGGDPPGDWRLVDYSGHDFWHAPDGDKHAVMWRGGGILYILVSDLPEATLLQLAAAEQ